MFNLKEVDKFENFCFERCRIVLDHLSYSKNFQKSKVIRNVTSIISDFRNTFWLHDWALKIQVSNYFVLYFVLFRHMHDIYDMQIE